MKAILPILICSAITAALGYYFGRISLPADTGASTVATASSSSKASPAAEVADTYVMPEPVEPVFEEAPTPVETPVVSETPVVETPEVNQSSFAERAAQTIQTLTDNQGRTIQASIVTVTASDVKIRRSDGLETTIPLSLLSEEDVAFCNYLRENQKKTEVKKPPSTDGFDWDSYFNS